MPQFVAMASTPISAEHARDALVAAMPGIDRESAALLLSLIWVETGRGSSMQNWNAGNITAGPSWGGLAWRPPWFETPGPLHDRMLAGTAPSAFRAYSSATEGFGDFVRVLKAQFKSVLEAAASGNPAAFVQALHDSGYSKDYNLSHVPTFAQLRESFGQLVAHLPAGGGAGVELAEGLALAAALFFGARAINRRRHHRRHS